MTQAETLKEKKYFDLKAASIFCAVAFLDALITGQLVAFILFPITITVVVVSFLSGGLWSALLTPQGRYSYFQAIVLGFLVVMTAYLFFPIPLLLSTVSLSDRIGSGSLKGPYQSIFLMTLSLTGHFSFSFGIMAALSLKWRVQKENGYQRMFLGIVLTGILVGLFANFIIHRIIRL